MAIYRLLAKSAFEPEDTKRMVEAYQLALVELGLKSRDDPLTETLAKFIVEVAQTGVKDAKMICALALSRLGAGTDREAC
jgi:hypothetical protein